ncbi:MAG: phage tail family protein [Clostridiales bacterium]|nr:phage tail family protein [Clostridiales bacterium]
MAKLKYVNSNNGSIELGNAAPFLITAVDGLGSPQNQIYTQKSPNQDGVTATHSSLGPRNIVLEGKIIDSNKLNRQTYRNKLLSVFNPKLDGKLIYESGEFKRQIDCKVEQAPYFPSESGQNHQDFSISLIAANPYFQDINTTKEEVAIWRGSFEFPLELVEEGIELGYREPRLIVNVLNKGDVPTGMRVQFKALATVVNPSLFNVNTREFFKVNRTMEAGEVITVTTHFQNKRVELNKDGVISNAFNWIDFQSTFLQLDPGDNLLGYDADEGIDSLEVSIWYIPQYLGV